MVTKVVDPTSTPSHYKRLSGYDCHILPFVDVEAKECIEYVIEKEEEGMEYNNGSLWSFNVCFHIDYIEYTHYLVDIDMGK